MSAPKISKIDTLDPAVARTADGLTYREGGCTCAELDVVQDNYYAERGVSVTAVMHDPGCTQQGGSRWGHYKGDLIIVTRKRPVIDGKVVDRFLTTDEMHGLACIDCGKRRRGLSRTGTQVGLSSAGTPYLRCEKCVRKRTTGW